MLMVVLVADVVNVQDDGEQLIWQEKTTSSSSTTHTACSSDKAAKMIGPRLEVYAMLHL